MKEEIVFRPYSDPDFEKINQLNLEENWTNLVENVESTQEAWRHSNVAFVAYLNDEVVGCLRGLTDGSVSLYVCELIVDKRHRGSGIGTRLLKYVHNLYPKTRLELLASSTSHSYYEKLKFRPFYGFRKTLIEWDK